MQRFIQVLIGIAIIANTIFTVDLLTRIDKIQGEVETLRVLSVNFVPVHGVLENLLTATEADRSFIEIFHNNRNDLSQFSNPKFATRIYSTQQNSLESIPGKRNKPLDQIKGIQNIFQGACEEDADAILNRVTLKCPFRDSNGQIIGLFGVTLEGRVTVPDSVNQVAKFYRSEISEAIFNEVK